MCDVCIYSWKPPVTLGLLIATALIPFGLDFTIEVYKDGIPVFNTTNGIDDGNAKYEYMDLYEGPALIGAGLLALLLGILLGIKGYHRQKELNDSERQRVKREAWETEQGPPPECVPQSQPSTKASVKDQFDDPERMRLSGDGIPPSPVPSISSAINQETLSLNSSRHGSPWETGSPRNTSPNRPKSNEKPLPMYTSPTLRAGNATEHWQTSHSDLSTVHEESVCGYDNQGFSADNQDAFPSRKTKDGRKDTAVSTSRKRENAKAISPGSACGNPRNYQKNPMNGEDVIVPRKSEVYNVEFTNTEDRGRDRGSSYTDRNRMDNRQQKPARSFKELQIRDPFPAVHLYKTKQQKDSGCYDSEADSAYLTSLTDDLGNDPHDDLHPQRPSAPDPGHRRNTQVRDKGTAKRTQKQDPRFSETKKVDYPENPVHKDDRFTHERDYARRTLPYTDRRDYPIVGEDSVFYDISDTRTNGKTHYSSPRTKRQSYDPQAQSRDIQRPPRRINVSEYPSHALHSPEVKRHSRDAAKQDSLASSSRIKERLRDVPVDVYTDRKRDRTHPRDQYSERVGERYREDDRLTDRGRGSGSEREQRTERYLDKDRRHQRKPEYKDTRRDPNRDLYDRVDLEMTSVVKSRPANERSSKDKMADRTSRDYSPRDYRRSRGYVDTNKRYRIQSDGATPKTTRRSNKDKFSRQKSTTSDVTSNRSKYYDGEISA